MTLTLHNNVDDKVAEQGIRDKCRWHGGCVQRAAQQAERKLKGFDGRYQKRPEQEPDGSDFE